LVFCSLIRNFAPDDESQKRLVVRHRVFFDANYSRIRGLERSLIRNPQNSQSPELPLYKEILQILAKLRKNERNAKGKLVFLFISECMVSSAKPKIHKVTRQTKEIIVFFAEFPKISCIFADIMLLRKTKQRNRY